MKNKILFIFAKCNRSRSRLKFCCVVWFALLFSTLLCYPTQPNSSQHNIIIIVVVVNYIIRCLRKEFQKKLFEVKNIIQVNFILKIKKIFRQIKENYFLTFNVISSRASKHTPSLNQRFSSLRLQFSSNIIHSCHLVSIQYNLVFSCFAF